MNINNSCLKNSAASIPDFSLKRLLPAGRSLLATAAFLAVPLAATAQPIINEYVTFHADAGSGQNSNEFIEIFGTGNTDFSAYSILVIDGDRGSQGVIDNVFAVGTTNANGYWTTTLPATDEIAQGTLTIILVQNFTGAQGNDLDTDNDGLFNTAPWTGGSATDDAASLTSGVVDAIAVSDGSKIDRKYVPQTTPGVGLVLGPGFDGVFLINGQTARPHGASRILDGSLAGDVNQISAWTRNAFSNIMANEARNTPDAINSAVTPPTFADAAFTVAEDAANTTVVGTMTAVSTDADSTVFTYSITGGNTDGAFSVTTVSNSGEIRVANSTALDFESDPTLFLTVQVQDQIGQTVSATVTISVTNVNEGPVAQDDGFTVAEDSGVTALNVILNNGNGIDTDPESNTLIVSAVGATDNNGTVDIVGNQINYTPATNFFGDETFSYTLSDGNLTDMATVTVMVTAVNDAPVARSDVFTVLEDAMVTSFDVRANNGLGADSDVDSVNLDVTAVTAPNNGGTAVRVGNNIEYTPADNFSGNETFTYTLSDGFLTDDATVSVTVTEVNDAPIANNQAVTATEDLQLEITLTGDDGDANSVQSLTFILTSLPDTGTLSQTSGGDAITIVPTNLGGSSLFFTTAPGDVNPQEFDFGVKDDGGTDPMGAGVDTSPTDGTVTIDITPVNDPPVANDDTFFVDEGGTLPQALANANMLVHLFEFEGDFTDTLGNGVDLSPTDILAVPGSGSYTFDANEGLGLIADIGLAGNYSFGLRFSFQDVAGFRKIIDFSGLLSGIGLYILDGKLTFFNGLGSGSTDILANEVIDLVITRSSADNTVNVYLNGSSTPEIQFTDGAGDAFPQPTQFFFFEDELSGAESSDGEVFEIRVWNNPLLAGEIANAFSDFNVLDNDQDQDLPGDNLTVTLVADSGPSHAAPGTFVLNGDGTFTYEHDGSETTTDSFQYRVTDNGPSSDTATVTITINPVNDPPVAIAQQLSTDEDTDLLITLTGTDAEDDSLTFAVVDDPTDGVLTGNAPNLTYTPGDNFVGMDSFTFDANDVAADSVVPATISITVNAVNDDPTLDDPADEVIDEDDPMQTVGLTGIGPGGGPDEVNQVLTVTATSDNTDLIPDPDVTFVQLSDTADLDYTPVADQNGMATITVTVMDDGGLSATQEFTVTVNAVNDAPSFDLQASDTVLEDSGQRMVDDWATAFSPGPDNESGQTVDSFDVTEFTNPNLFAAEGGAPTIDVNGKLTYTPAADAVGSSIVTVTVTDTGGTNPGVDTSGEQTFTINVTAVNDAPSFALVDIEDTVDEDFGEQILAGWASSISRGPMDEDGQGLEFSLTNSDNTLFSNQPAIDTSGQLTYTPADDANGSATVMVTLMDTGGMDNDGIDTFGPLEFTINVTAVNDPPSFDLPANDTVLEDSGGQTREDWASNIFEGAANELEQTVTFNVVNNNNDLFSEQPAIDADGQLTYTPAPDAHGDATVTVTANDGEDDSPPGQDFTIMVTAVNDVPSFTKGGNDTVLEDSGERTVAAWAMDIFEGAANEFGQGLEFIVTENSNSELFAVGGAPFIDPDSGDLIYTPADDAFGSAVIKVVLMDDDGTDDGGFDTSAEETFTINVTAVNDEPSFTDGGSDMVLEDSGERDILWATNIFEGATNEADQPLEFKVTENTNTLLFAEGGAPAIDAETGNLTYTPADDAFGEADITVELFDNSSTGVQGDDDTSDPVMFTISVTAVNDEPTFTPRGDDTVLEDSPMRTVAAWAADIFAGADNESGQVLEFNVDVLTNPDLFAGGGDPAIDPTNGNLTYTPAPDAFGDADIRVELMDLDGIPNGGDDTSAFVDFIITVTPVNDAPIFVVGEDQSVTENSGMVEVPDWTTGFSVGPDNEIPIQNLTVFNVTVDTNPGLFAAEGGAPAVSPDGTLTFTPAADVNGVASISITLSDSGDGVAPDVNTSEAQTFTIEVTEVNNLPTLDALEPVNIDEDGTPATVELLNITPGANEEQDLAVSAVSDNQALINNANLIITYPVTATTGTLVYTLEADQHGDALITVTVTDAGLDNDLDTTGDNATVEQSFLVTVNPVNDAPSFIKGTDITVQEDSAPYNQGWATDLSVGPQNEGDQSLIGFNVMNDKNTLFSVQPAIDEVTGNLTFTPALNAIGSALVSVSLSDDGGFGQGQETFSAFAKDAKGTTTVKIGNEGGGEDTSAVQTFTIKVTPVNDAPSFVSGGDVTVAEDSGLYNEDWATSLSVGPDDEVDEPQALTFFTVTNNNNDLFSAQPAIDVSGQLTFTPADNASGVAMVTVTLSDNGGTATLPDAGEDTSAEQVFLIEVTPVNDAPVATGQTVETDEDVVLSIDLAGTDIDNDDSSLIFTIINGPTNGVLTGDLPNQLYTPNTNYNGPDSFTFSANDGDADSATDATVSITVNPVNDQPVADDQTVEAIEDVQLSITLVGDDSEPEEPPQTLTFTIVDLPSMGTLRDTESGDPLGDGAVLDDDVVFFTTAQDEVSQQTFTFSVSDDGGGDDTSEIATVTVNITPVNDQPVADDQEVTATEDVQLPIILVGDDSEPEGPPQTLTFTIVSLPAMGTLRDTASGDPLGDGAELDDNLVFFTTAQDEVSQQTFTFQVSDGGGDGNETSAIATVTVSVTPVNDQPVAADQEVQATEDVETSITLTGDDSDPEDPPQTLTFTIESLPDTGSLSDEPSGAALQIGSVLGNDDVFFTTAPNDVDQQTFTFSVSDDGGGDDTSANATVTVNINPVNDGPTVDQGIDDQFAPEDMPFNFAVPGNAFADVDIGDSLSFSATLSSGGALPDWLTFTTDTFTGTPRNADVGAITIRVTATDDGSATIFDDFVLTVNNVNDAPVAVDETFPISETAANGDPVGTVDASDDDVGDVLNFTITGGDPTNNFIIGLTSGAITVVVPPALVSGTVTLTVNVSDGELSDNATITVNIQEFNDPPTIQSGIADVEVDEDADDTVINLQAPQAFTDEETAVADLTYTVEMISDGSLFTGVSIDNNDTDMLTIDYAPNAFGFADITIRATDDDVGDPKSVDDTFRVTVNKVNDAPTISAIKNQFAFVDTDTAGNPGEPTEAIAFTVNDDETLASDLAVSVQVTSGGSVIASTVLGGSGSNRTIVVTPVDGISTFPQMATIQITVQDDDAAPLSANTSFDVEIQPKPKFPVVRNLPDFYVPGVAFQVTIDLTPSLDTTFYIVHDVLSIAWDISNASDDGMIFPTEQRVSFGGFNPDIDNLDNQLEYFIAVPDGSTQTLTFTGLVISQKESFQFFIEREISPVTAETYADWRLRVFGPIDGATAVSAAGVDFSSDGIVNGTAYAMGFDPTINNSADPGLVTTSTFDNNGVSTARMVFQRSSSAVDVIYTVQDGAGTPLATQPTQRSVTATDGVNLSVTVEVPVAGLAGGVLQLGLTGP